MDAINYTTFYLGAQQFSSQIDPRIGTVCIHSIHPYDETEYHWARQGVTGYSWYWFHVLTTPVLRSLRSLTASTMGSSGMELNEDTLY